MENSKIILSIIVPIYNVERYLKKCIDSLLNQDIPSSEYEIILVDDGSTDSCPAICDEYERAYPQPLPKGKGEQPCSNSSPKVRESFASVWGAHTADSTQYKLLEADARENRKNPTEAESVLWDMLQGNGIGLHFRRQHVILDYIVDFICLEKGLIIELDGGDYDNSGQKAKDEQRTAHLTKLGYTELRFKNEELLIDPEGVIEQIKAMASSLPSLKGRVWDRPSIKVIHRKNGGLSAARNSGIEIAQGEYIMFVDSDDYMQPNVLGTLMEQMEDQQLDVLRYNYQNVRLTKSEERRVKSVYEVFQPFKAKKPYFDYSSEVVDGETFLNERLGYACYAWAFVLRRDLIYVEQREPYTLHHTPYTVNSSVLFTPGIYFEDTEWTPRMLIRAKRVASTELIVYNYLWREGSITLPDNPEKKKKVLEDKISLLRGFKEQQKMVQNKQWFIWQTAGATMSILGILSTYSKEVRKPYIKQLKELDVFPLSTYRAVGNNKYKIRMANLSPRLYCCIMHAMHLLKE